MDETCRLRRGEEYGACADEGAGSLPNASNRAEARTHFYKWNIGMQVRIECENPNLPKFTARYGSI